MKKYFIFSLFLLFLLIGCTIKEDQKPIIQLIEPSSSLISEPFNLKFKISDDIYLKNWEISIDNQIISALKFDRIKENEIEVSSIKPYNIDNIPDGDALNIIISAEDNIGNKTTLKKEIKIGRLPKIKLLPEESIYDTVEGTFNIIANIKDIDVLNKEDLYSYTLSISKNDDFVYLFNSDDSVKTDVNNKEATITTDEFKASNYSINDILTLNITATDRASNTAYYEKKIKIGGYPPEINLIEPNKYSSNSTNLIIIAEISDDVEITDINLKVNNIDKTIDSNFYIDSLDSTSLSYNNFKEKSYLKKVYLKNDNITLEDTNYIEIISKDRAGNTTTRGFIVTYENKSFKITKAW
ncbi:hypothetical protein [Marinitoga sp. 38H-ov]|uniref:hypothetical protein n=1 Tax=Marinitoga sp. 38H-ov TaxID=1755814 RepID=UPI0013EBB994|nr:hypothetical protein [Marinitoga sp. 38H-ov]KAF2955253.1 hypothetical protein AS160_01765 [Marinitoga sp. 38H-ov]